MNRVNYFLWLARIGEEPMYYEPAGVSLLIALIIAVAAKRSGVPGALGCWTRTRMALFLTPVLASFFILLLGTVLVAAEHSTAQQNRATLPVNGLLIWQFSAAALLVFRSPGARVFVAALLLPSVWYCCLAALMATMSVTGNWL